MSITRERLDELVEQKAKIYSIGKSNNVFCVGLKFRDCYKNTEWWETKMQRYCDYFYETQKEAEFIAKYTKIPRTEYLDLPTFEDFCKNCNNDIMFYIEDKRFVLEHWNEGFEAVRLRWDIYDCDCGTLFYEPRTEENYYKVLDMCVKLWKGE